MQLGAAIFHVSFGPRCGEAHYPGVRFTSRNKAAVVVCDGAARGCCDARDVQLVLRKMSDEKAPAASQAAG
jgi:hypothetical protein